MKGEEPEWTICSEQACWAVGDLLSCWNRASGAENPLTPWPSPQLPQYHCNKYLGSIYSSTTSPNIQSYSNLKQMLICHHSSGIRSNFPHCYCFFCVCVQHLSLNWTKTRPIRCLLNLIVRVDPFCVTCVISSAHKRQLTHAQPILPRP